jgi:hypothetical protein
MEPKPSPFLLIFRDTTPDCYRTISLEQRQQLLQQWNEWYDQLALAGKVEHGHPLEPGGRIVAGPRGERTVDGPFAEATEAIGGYFFLTVADLDEATEIARGCPSLPLGMSIEVRAVAGACARLGIRGKPRSMSEPVLT